jgi:uncharacterized protein YbjT (DUF2867 family)
MAPISHIEADARAPIAVTGATGTVGAGLVARLLRRGAKVRALARHASGALAGSPGVDPVDCDLHDPTAVAAGLAGCGALFLLTPLEEAMPALGARVVALAREAGVGRIVRLSAFGAGGNEPNTLGRVHREVERAVEASGAEWTVLRPNSFMQNYATYCAATIRADGVFHMPQGDGAVSVVDARDVAAVAERALLEPRHVGQVYELTGPEALSNARIATELTGALGRPVRYVDVDEAEAAAGLAAAGVPRWLVGVIMELYAMSKAGRASRVSGDVERVLGRPATPFARYSSECAGAYV